jgi:hypothetical protein
MSSTSAPFGLQPIYHASGSVRPQAFTLVDNYSATLLQNQPVKLGTDGTLQPAAAGDAFIGVFQGVEFTDSDGRRRVSNKWIANNTGTDITAYATSDPYIVYQIQTNSPVTITNIGNQADTTVAGSGSTVVGLSQMMLNTTTAGGGSLVTSGIAQLRIVGLTPYADNAWGDSYVVTQVEISKHQFVNPQGAIA